VRSRNPSQVWDSVENEIVLSVLDTRIPAAATRIVPTEALKREGTDLAEQARIPLIPTPKARLREESEETSGMAIEAAAPVLDSDGSLIGVLFGGKLLNRRFDIVDAVKDIVYRGEEHEKKDVGTVTIFQDDLRISTNVLREDGERAIGTRVSEEVYDHVVGEGMPWIGRAFVVNNWYITAYEPIHNLRGKIIGMLYVGMMEAPYVDLKNRVVITFLGIGILSVILLLVIAQVTTRTITKPVNDLLLATKRVARGDLAHRVRIETKDEIGQLSDSFNRMTAELEKATRNYEILTRTLEVKIREKTRELREAQDQLIQTEKMSSLGKLSAGIAHEINNPLTSILINSHLIAETLGENIRLRENLDLIIEETSRCAEIVKGLLEFSRQTPAEKEPMNINDVIRKTLLLLRSQILMHKVEILEDLEPELPILMADVNKIEQVLTNIILNALDAMRDGGILTIRSRTSGDDFVEIDVQDTGHGIPEESLGKVFDPFFTTKGTKGTGLGLSVSYGIIQQHDGKIAVRSEVGTGTVLTLRLPTLKK
jgi:two-component system NtrC family sensor kinase